MQKRTTTTKLGEINLSIDKHECMQKPLDRICLVRLTTARVKKKRKTNNERYLNDNIYAYYNTVETY